MNTFRTGRGTEREGASTSGPEPIGIVRARLLRLPLEAARMSQDEHIRRAILELIGLPQG